MICVAVDIQEKVQQGFQLCLVKSMRGKLWKDIYLEYFLN